MYQIQMESKGQKRVIEPYQQTEATETTNGDSASSTKA